MKGNQIHLYHAATNLTIGRLLAREMSFESGAGRGFKLTYDFVPGKEAPHGQWLTLEAQVNELTQSAFGRGRVDIHPRQRPNLNPPTDSGLEFLWVVQPHEIEAIEKSRAPGQPLRVRVDVNGLLKTASDILEVRGDGSIEVAVSEWTSLLETYGYRLPPSVADYLTAISTTDDAWTEAVNRLTPARRHLREGETYAALSSCLGEFEKLAQKPYLAASWIPKFGALPDQKREGLAAMLAGLCSYLNRVGHHKDRSPDETGDHPAMPVDYWESETSVATSHLMLALALRLSRRATRR